MNTHTPKDPWQAAADNAGGFEGQRLSHNCKSGLILLESVQVEPGFRCVFLVEEATHGWLRFEENEKVGQDIRRFADEAPDQDEKRDGWAPNTACLCVGADGQLLTYAGASWGVRGAFVSQLVRPYQRLRRSAFPVVTLGFKAQLDDNGNHKPLFNVVDWRPRTAFASILGEGGPDPRLPAPQEHSDVERPTRHLGRATYESGPPVDRDGPPIEDSDGYGGVDGDVEF